MHPLDRCEDAAPGARAFEIAGGEQLVGAAGRVVRGRVAVALQQLQRRRIDIAVGDGHAAG